MLKQDVLEHEVEYIIIMLFEDFSDLTCGLPRALTHIASMGALSGFHCLLWGRRVTFSPLRDAPKLNGAAPAI